VLWILSLELIKRRFGAIEAAALHRLAGDCEQDVGTLRRIGLGEFLLEVRHLAAGDRVSQTLGRLFKITISI
jgi:hypothetical protein